MRSRVPGSLFLSLELFKFKLCMQATWSLTDESLLYRFVLLYPTKLHSMLVCSIIYFFFIDRLICLGKSHKRLIIAKEMEILPKTTLETMFSLLSKLQKIRNPIHHKYSSSQDTLPCAHFLAQKTRLTTRTRIWLWHRYSSREKLEMGLASQGKSIRYHLHNWDITSEI